MKLKNHKNTLDHNLNCLLWFGSISILDIYEMSKFSDDEADF